MISNYLSSQGCFYPLKTPLILPLLPLTFPYFSVTYGKGVKGVKGATERVKSKEIRKGRGDNHVQSPNKS